jgi:hypothetical protein
VIARAGGWVRVAVVVAAIVVVGGSLTGCTHTDLSGRQAPAAGVTASTTAPASVGSGDASWQSIQDELNSADSATNNAGGDVTDAESAAATSDSP